MIKMNPKPAIKEREPKVPTDLRKALATNLVAKVKWKDLTPIARRDFISWLDAAKKPETRTRKIEKACSMLATPLLLFNRVTRSSSRSQGYPEGEGSVERSYAGRTPGLY